MNADQWHTVTDPAWALHQEVRATWDAIGFEYEVRIRLKEKVQ